MPRCVPAVADQRGRAAPTAASRSSVGHQPEGQRPHQVRPGSPGRIAAVGADELGLPGVADAAGERRRSARRPPPGRGRRRCGQQRRGAGVVGGRDVALVGGRRTPPMSAMSSPGSSHSPQWKPVSHRYRSCGAGSGPRGPRRVPPLAAICSRAVRASGPWSATARRGSAASPYARYSSQGTITAASPQPAEPLRNADRAVPALGARGRATCSRPCRRPTGRRRRRAATSPRSRPRRRGTRRSGTKSCQSPVHPARSRCGQSVGMSQALSRKLHTAASCSRLTRSSLQENQPVRRMSVCTTTPRDVVGGQVAAGDPRRGRTGSRAWCAAARRRRRHARRRRPVDLPGGQRLRQERARPGRRCSIVTSPSASEPLAVRRA